MKPLVAPLAAAACVACTVPAERQERDLALERAMEPCTQQFPGSRVTSIDRHGMPHVVVQDFRDLEGFRKCAGIELARLRETRPVGAGRVAAGASKAALSVQASGGGLLVPVLVNGVSARLLLDTGATMTLISPALAQRAGLEPGWQAPRVRATVVGGGQISVPFIRVKSFGVNEAAVEDMDVGVFDALPGRTDVDGLLGANFLNHFRVTVDRKQRRLVLEPL